MKPTRIECSACGGYGITPYRRASAEPFDPTKIDRMPDTPGGRCPDCAGTGKLLVKVQGGYTAEPGPKPPLPTTGTGVQKR